jgi:hypothetical protein
MSIRWLLVTITFLAVACVAAKQGTQPWMVGAVTAMFALLMFCTVLAITSRGRGRVFAQGFSIVGWLYILLVACGFEYSLATTWGSQLSYGLVKPKDDQDMTYYGAWFRTDQEPDPAYANPYGGSGGYGGPTRGQRRGAVYGYSGAGYGAYGEMTGSPSLTHFARFMHVNQAIWVVLLGNIGGLLATCCARDTIDKRKQQAKSQEQS